MRRASAGSTDDAIGIPAHPADCDHLGFTGCALRVIFLTHYFPPEVGAPQTRFSWLTQGLAESGVEVTVHTCFPHYPDGRIRPPYRNRLLLQEDRGPVRVVRSAVYASPNRGFARRVANHASFGASALATARSAGPADAVVVETPPLLLAGASIPYARLKRAALVVNVADLWPESAIELGALTGRAPIRAAEALERACYRSAAAITCPTDGIAERLEARPESGDKVRRIAPVVDLDRFPAAAGDGSAGRGKRPFRVVYAGTIGLAQGLGTLLEAASLLEREGPAVEVLVAGDGAEAPELQARLAPEGPRNVRMLGAVPAAEVPGLYAEADAAAVLLRDRPLFAGALPTKMLEAMAAARPIVLSGSGEAARFIAAAGGGVVVPPENPAALAAAIRELASDPERSTALGSAGRSYVERGFGVERAIAEWHELLARVTRSAR
jgi:colanic acid biosynthesis glycosyl transferase WcaI